MPRDEAQALRGRSASCAHPRVKPPSWPVPDWTGLCPDCRERVKHDGHGGFITVRENNERARLGLRQVRVNDLVADLRDDHGPLDSVIGQAIDDQRRVGAGVIATARAVREALAEHFDSVGQDEEDATDAR